ncbi:hypothetical protein [Argonema antarcticum]|uniref:hypothetical protein n=1 Tax=Argonema antarcticum TaxID=2942763 RepID=UPI0020117D63|nr:hypothetical protein [Argonema antarcticum]MCL1470396.1 hypothetical protein [Argonema antarcticum A004/B2]
MSETWIIFHAEPDQPGWENRKLPMGGLTGILDEQWDYTGSGQIPQVGERFRQFLQIEAFSDPQFPKSSTHSREGDWVVTGVERYSATSPDCSKLEIVLCYCKFDPVVSDLKPIGRGQPQEDLQVGHKAYS